MGELSNFGNKKANQETTVVTKMQDDSDSNQGDTRGEVDKPSRKHVINALVLITSVKR